MPKVVLLSLLTMLLQQSSPAQEPADDPFLAVPLESRGEVKAAVILIVKLHKERQWDKVYDLLSPETQALTSRAQYLRDIEHSPTLLEFLPTRIKEVTEKDVKWLVNGCALVDDHGKKRRWESFIKINVTGTHQRIYLVTALKKRGGPMPCLELPD